MLKSHGLEPREEKRTKKKFGSISLKWLSFPSLNIGNRHSIYTYKLNDSNRFPKLYE